jgi:phosphate transport system substrate-binding protein
LTISGSCGRHLNATRQTIKTEDYPLTAPMFLYFPARRLPKIAREFLAYTRSPMAQIVIRRSGFVDQSPEEIPLAQQGDRLTNAMLSVGDDVGFSELRSMIEFLKPMRRLTTSFRFDPGQTRLDAQSRSNIQQLARALETGTYDGRQLTFVGFSDGEGPSSGNREIAQKRAEAVRSAVLQAAEAMNGDRVRMDVVGFGEALPMACDDTAWGRKVNRRVEVWIH